MRLVSSIEQLNIDRNKFKTSIPDNLNPQSPAYKRYWTEQIKRCLEGYWVNGYWMPGKLYFYSNFCTIKRSKKGSGSGLKTYLNPLVRDIEWLIFLTIEEARGFSGFEGDDVYSCNRMLIDENYDDARIIEHCRDEDKNIVPELYNNYFQPSGKRKIYKEARWYMRENKGVALGRPLYFNQTQNFALMGSRDFGKSYSSGGNILHEFLFDGRTSLNDSKDKTADILVGAGDSKFSSETLSKVKEMLDRLPGEIKIGNKIYPSPLKKQYKGSFDSGKDVIAKYRKKVGGQWSNVGSGSSIKHRSFADSHAASGTRLSFVLLEEIGVFGNLDESYKPLIDTQKDGAWKFGYTEFIGTGAVNMGGGATLAAMNLFYNPEHYECLAFEDDFEFKGKIGLFMPAYLAMNEYKDSNGKTDIKKAKEFILKERKRLRDIKATSRLESYIVNRPIAPSEMFLLNKGSFFPTTELQNRLTEIQAGSLLAKTQKIVELYYSPKTKYGVDYKIDTSGVLKPINTFPSKEENLEGAVVLYDLPVEDKEGNIPKGLYVIGVDPKRTDSQSGSLATVFVLKTNKYLSKYGPSEIVAVYRGAPFYGRNATNEIILKLSMLYGNAKVMFENNVGNVREYFERRGKLHLLHESPKALFNKKNSSISMMNSDPLKVEYGFTTTDRRTKLEGIGYINDFLMEEISSQEGNIVRNLDRIPDQALLQEMITFNLEGNFDSIMAFMGCILALEMDYKKLETSLIREVNQVDQIQDAFVNWIDKRKTNEYII